MGTDAPTAPPSSAPASTSASTSVAPPAPTSYSLDSGQFGVLVFGLALVVAVLGVIAVSAWGRR